MPYLYKTKLEFSKPVLCAGLHADPALGTTGVKGVKSMSPAMHGSHASRMAPVAKRGNNCYACHPGFKIQLPVRRSFFEGYFVHSVSWDHDCGRQSVSPSLGE